MKTIITIWLLFSIGCGAAVADELKRVVLHVNEPQKFHLLIDTVQFFKQSHPDVQISVVVNGPAVVRLSKRLNYGRELVRNAHWVGACSFSMFDNKLAQKDLTEGIEFLQETGLIALINFQKDGYAYVKI